MAKLAELIAAAAHDCGNVDCPCDPETTIYASASTGGVVTLIEGPPETIAAVVQPELDRLNAQVTDLLHDMATVARHIEDGEYGDADKAARQALGIAPGVDLPGRES